MGCFNYFIVVFVSILSLNSAKEFVPVLIWGSQSSVSTGPEVSGLQKYSTDEFSDFMLKKVNDKKPMVLVFEEENLSVEDFSWRDVDDNPAFPQLRNITQSSGGLDFFSAVENPHKALRKLRNHDYSWQLWSDESPLNIPKDEAIVMLVKLDDPLLLDDRPDMLQAHDEQIARVYSKVLEAVGKEGQVLAIYTGRHCSWIDAAIDDEDSNRVRRDAPEGDAAADDDVMIIVDDKKKVLIAVRGGITFKKGTDEKKYTKFVTPTIDKETEEGLSLDAKFKTDDPADQLDVDFNFAGNDGSAWQLKDIFLEGEDVSLTSVEEVYGPRWFSYYCGKGMTFTGTKNSVVYTLQFNSFQAQIFPQDGKFGWPVDCVTYFSAPIWSGIFIIFIMALITGWGVIMIMDINTNDRFDDPKGKTITISATD